MDSGVDGRGFDAAPWPFGAEKARKELDVELIEEHAADIVARALTTKRLTIFAGAGLTMAYGRMTWGQLLDLMFKEVCKAEITPDSDDFARRRKQAVDKMTGKLWPNKFADFSKHKGDHAIAAQLFGDIEFPSQPLRKTSGQQTDRTTMSLHEWVANNLQDHLGRLEQLIAPISQAMSAELDGKELESNKVRDALCEFISPYVKQAFDSHQGFRKH